VARKAEHSRPLFPSVHRLLLEHTVTNLEKIKGTGVRGMLTKGDVLTFLGKASNPLGTFKFGLSPIEEASKLVLKEKDVVLQVRHFCSPSCLLNSVLFLARLRRLSTERPYVDLSSIQCFKALSKPAILHQACFSYKFLLPPDFMFLVRP
jgi:e3 binding domain